MINFLPATAPGSLQVLLLGWQEAAIQMRPMIRASWSSSPKPEVGVGGGQAVHSLFTLKVSRTLLSILRCTEKNAPSAVRQVEKTRTASGENTDKKQKVSRASFLKVKFLLCEKRIGQQDNRAEGKDSRGLSAWSAMFPLNIADIIHFK